MGIETRWGVAAGLACLLVARQAGASGPEIGANAGVAVPLQDYADSADIGGTLGFFGGYRFSLNEGVALALIAQPQFTFLPTSDELSRLSDDVSSMAILAAGPKLILGNGPWYATVGGQGGYYRDMSGPLDADGGGWNVFGDVSYEVAPNATLGLFARFDQADMRPSVAADADDTRQLFLGGLAFSYVFAAAEPVEPAPPPPPPPAPVAAAKRKIVLRGVNFDFDKATIRPDAKPILNEAIEILEDAPDVRITVDGYTDGIGTEAYNQRLSERRANAVASYLQQGGIAASRMKAIGHGESDPVASNETADGRAQNRRVELNVVSPGS